MKIGVTAIGYECAEHLDKVLKPWNELKQQGVEVYISVAHGVFPEVAQLGFGTKSLDGTIELLQERLKEGKIDNLEVKGFPTKEKELRNATLPFLFDKGIDLLWLLDLQDEIYTVEQIKDILRFIKENEEYSWFKINFKNYVFSQDTFIDDFVVPRVWKNNCNQGIAGFWYDNDIIYKSGEIQTEIKHTTIPKESAFIKHLSWVGSKEYLIRKIEFQKIHYGFCSYKWNTEKDELEFNADFYKMVNKGFPTLYKDK